MSNFLKKIAKLLQLDKLKVNQKLQRLIIIFIALISIIILYTSFTLYQQKNDGLVINIAGRQRMLSQKFTKEIFLAFQKASLSQQPADFSGSTNTRRLFEISLTALNYGGRTFSDPKMTKEITLPGLSQKKIKFKLATVEKLWRDLIINVEEIGEIQPDKAQLDKLNSLSVNVLVEMNKAVGMIANAADKKVFILQIALIIMWLLAIAIAIPLTRIIVFSITEPLSKMLFETKRITTGDLKPNLQNVQKTKDELGILAKNIDTMREGLSNIINTVQQNARQMLHSATQVANVSREISDSVEKEQEGCMQIHDTTNNLQQISTTVNEHVLQTLDSISITKDQAQKGIVIIRKNIEELENTVQGVDDTAKEMVLLKEATGQIQTIIVSIQNITDQTNLLALNATIEAARAGEAGKGFAVVANEIKDLAGQIAQSTVQITDLLNNFSRQVSSAVEAMQEVVTRVNYSQQQSDQTVTAFETMNNSVADIFNRANDISKFNKQQQTELIKLEDHFDILFKVLQNNNTKSDSTIMVAKELSLAAENLQSVLKNFSTDVPKSAVRSKEEKRHFPRIKNSIIVKLTFENKIIEAITSDISMGGLNLRVRRQLPVGQIFPAELMIPKLKSDDKKSKLQIKIKTIRETKDESDYLYGVEYIDIAKEQQKIIEEIFDFYQKPYNFA